MNDVLIKPLHKKHIDNLLKINSMCFETPWHKEAFLKELENKFARYMVAIKNNKVIAYAGIWIILDEVHIVSIAVHPNYRQKGIASLLMDNIFKFCRENNKSSITLEVRKSNIAAQKLYKKYGFIDEGIRKAYYSNREDAVIMWNRNINLKSFN